MKSAKITDIKAIEILDSRGNPTVQVTLYSGKLSATAAVPSGASTGSHEALELRDGDKKRFGGKGVLRAVHNINTEIAKKVTGMNAAVQDRLDAALLELDGTENKSKLGANSILAVSLASARLAALAQNIELYLYLAATYGYATTRLPKIMCNVINGGVHADSGMEIQEFMIVPQRANVRERLQVAAEVYVTLKNQLAKQKHVTSVGDEGGFAPHLKNNEAALKELMTAIKAAGYKPGKDVVLALDAAASEFYDPKKRSYRLDRKQVPGSQLSRVYGSWVSKYPLVSMEDVFAEDDFENWKNFTKTFGEKVMLVGDDLFVTNQHRLQMGISDGFANAILIKPNQIGTLTETMETIHLAQEHKYAVIISHRSGETTDTFISDLSVAVSADYIKTGSLARGERIAKYNRLLEIEQLHKNN